jgi:hypothetical protein
VPLWEICIVLKMKIKWARIMKVAILAMMGSENGRIHGHEVLPGT